MNPLIIYTVVIDDKYSSKYKVMADVLSHSISKNCKNVEHRIVNIPYSEIEYKLEKDKKQKNMLVKLTKYKELFDFHYMREGDEISNLCFMDADMVVLSDFSELLKYKFDALFTVRDIETHKYNTGFMILRTTDLTKLFFSDWIYYEDACYSNRDCLSEGNKPAYGFNQASLALAIKNYPDGRKKIKIKEVPCQKYNSCWGTWDKINNETKIIHVNGRCQKAIFEKGFSAPKFMETPVKIWKEYCKGFIDDLYRCTI